MKRILVFIMIGISMLTACSGNGAGIQVRDAWTRPALQDGNGAVYFVMQNNAAEADEMTGVASDVAAAVELHETTMQGDVMQMQQVASIALPGNTKVELAPGGFHVMLIGLKRDLKTGEEIELTLQFANHEDITLTAPVQELPGNDAMGDQ